MGIKKLICITFLLSLLIIPSLLLRTTGISSSGSNKIPKPNSKVSLQYPVSFAYLISASRGDVERVKRLLRAIYHPGNHYLLHLDLEAPPGEHRELSRFVSTQPTFMDVGNVWIVSNSNLVTYRGPTMLSTTLHAISVLLRLCRWDWFINLSASDYPLITQDDMIDAFSKLPRDLNFIHHTSHLGWKIKKRAKPVVLDTALYDSNKSELIRPPDTRDLPTAFKLYTGSAWTVLSRPFAEYCIMGWDNLPRTLLLYYTNFISSPEGYFQTVICNSNYFRNTTVNHDLHYIAWDNPPKQHPLYLGLKDYRRMILSSRLFARKFKADDPVLDRIDREVLRRKHGSFTYGGWCSDGEKRMCSNYPRTDGIGVLKAGAGSRRIGVLLSKLVSAKHFRQKQCK